MIIRSTPVGARFISGGTLVLGSAVWRLPGWRSGRRPWRGRRTARAWAVEGGGNARLQVSFFWPFRADYWVIGLDTDYRWAVVGNPGRKYLWILARTPKLPQDQLDAALASARAQAFDLAQLRYTKHEPASGR